MHLMSKLGQTFISLMQRLSLYQSILPTISARSVPFFSRNKFQFCLYFLSSEKFRFSLLWKTFLRITPYHRSVSPRIEFHRRLHTHKKGLLSHASFCGVHHLHHPLSYLDQRMAHFAMENLHSRSRSL